MIATKLKKEDGSIPANSCAADLDSNFSRVQSLSTLDILERGLRFSDPEVMVGVCEDTDVGLVDSNSGSAGHGAGRMT